MTTKQRANDTAAPPPDPFELWRKFYDANEAVWSKAAKEATSSEAFAEAQGRMLETFLAFQRGAKDAMNAQLATLNLPSRDDVARLGELLIGIEEKIDKLDDRLSAMERAARPARKPAARRLRR